MFEFVTGYFKGVGDRGGSLLGTAVGTSEEQNAGRRGGAQRQQRAEIAVGGDHHSPLLVSGGEHLLIASAQEIQLARMNSVVAGVGQEGGHTMGEALIDQQPHAEDRSGRVR